MLSSIANEFANITKFNLYQYFIDYRDFMLHDYNDIYNYYTGQIENIDASKLLGLQNLISRSNDLSRCFSTFSGKLGKVGYWELQQYCQDLKDTLERVTKLPKYNRTAKSARGYKPCIQTTEAVGGMKTVQDIANDLSTVSEQELILNNDLEEANYEIDKLSGITAYVDNNTGVVVTTILDQPIDKRIYGMDIRRKLKFADNDLDIVRFEDNVDQKCEILLELNKGDVPEMPQFGKNLNVGVSYSNYNYAELLKDLKEVFLQDDLFESVTIKDIKVDNGDIEVACEINTKYVYSTTKTLKI